MRLGGAKLWQPSGAVRAFTGAALRMRRAVILRRAGDHLYEGEHFAVEWRVPAGFAVF